VTNIREHTRALVAALTAGVAVSGCAATIREAARHELGGGIGVVSGDERRSESGSAALADGFAWTASYAVDVCPGCESFDMAVDLPVIVNPSQGVREATPSVPDRRQEVFVIPNLRFSAPFGPLGVFAGFGAGLGHFGESAQLTTGAAHDDRDAARAVIGLNAGADLRVSRRLSARAGLWVVGPRPDLSLPPPDPDCSEYCGDTVFILVFSSIFRF